MAGAEGGVPSESGVVVGASPSGDERFTLFYGSEPVFSNFHPSTFSCDGLEFNCTEQYFHYKKAELFDDQRAMESILASSNPREQKRLGRSVRGYDVEAWQDACEGVMTKGVYAKFSKNAELRKILFESAGTTLVEASARDFKWGIGLGLRNPKALHRRYWRGENLLGKVLMVVRDDLMKLHDAPV